MIANQLQNGFNNLSIPLLKVAKKCNGLLKKGRFLLIFG